MSNLVLYCYDKSCIIYKYSLNEYKATPVMKKSTAIAILEDQIGDASTGLPEEIFYFVSRTTPMVNVDLLIKDETNRTLLAWRNDSLAGQGWHLPGGIIRFKEKIEDRLVKVAEIEVGVRVGYDPEPIAINQIIVDGRNTRGHFISLLYKCRLNGEFRPRNDGLRSTDAGYLRWHSSCPEDLLKWHDIYRTQI